MNYIEEFCDQIAILKDGKVVLSGDLYDLKRNYVRDRLVISTPMAEQIKAEYGEACKNWENGTLLLQLSDPTQKQSVMKHLVENYDIDVVKVYEPSLNDIFVEYARDRE